jgi:hypothetical protein
MDSPDGQTEYCMASNEGISDKNASPIQKREEHLLGVFGCNHYNVLVLPLYLFASLLNNKKEE